MCSTTEHEGHECDCDDIRKEVYSALSDSQRDLGRLVEQLSNSHRQDVERYTAKVEELLSLQFRTFTNIFQSGMQDQASVSPVTGTSARVLFAPELDQHAERDDERHGETGGSPVGSMHTGMQQTEERHLGSSGKELQEKPRLWADGAKRNVSVPGQPRSGVSPKIVLRSESGMTATSASPSVLMAKKWDTRAAYDVALQHVENLHFHHSKWFPKDFRPSRAAGGGVSQSKQKSWLVDVVESRIFGIVSALLIVSNASFIGIKVDQDMRVAINAFSSGVDSFPGAWDTDFANAVDIFYAAVFFLELFLRMAALRSYFWCGPEWKWNLFDFVVVVAGAVESVFHVSNVDATFLRLIRLLRMIRTVQVVRRLRLFSKLRLMLLAIFESVVSLIWALVLLVAFMFLFAVVFLQAAKDHMESAPHDDMAAEVLATFFHSLPMALLTLCMSISGGVNWWEIQAAFLDFSPFCSAMFIVYLALMILAMLNIVTGIFVNDAIEVAQSDRELRAMAALQRHANSIGHLRETFNLMDVDDSGKITLEEFKASLQNLEVRLTLESLGVDMPNAVCLFTMLDVNGDFELEIDEFVMGCSALAVSAKSIDMEHLKSQSRKLLRHMKVLQKQVDCLAALLPGNVQDHPASDPDVESVKYCTQKVVSTESV